MSFPVLNFASMFPMYESINIKNVFEQNYTHNKKIIKWQINDLDNSYDAYIDLEDKMIAKFEIVTNYFTLYVTPNTFSFSERYVNIITTILNMPLDNLDFSVKKFRFQYFNDAFIFTCPFFPTLTYYPQIVNENDSENNYKLFFYSYGNNSLIKNTRLIFDSITVNDDKIYYHPEKILTFAKYSQDNSLRMMVMSTVKDKINYYCNKKNKDYPLIDVKWKKGDKYYGLFFSNINNNKIDLEICEYSNEKDIKCQKCFLSNCGNLNLFDRLNAIDKCIIKLVNKY